MSAVPGSLSTDAQPPMAIPLAHFVVGLGFLLAGVIGGAADALGLGGVAIVHLHLVLAGWVCVTIMGALTQFVPVWSGVTLHDRRLAVAQLWLVTVGLVGFGAALVADWYVPAVAFGAVLAVGLWTFAYNVGRTLWGVWPPDVTERHFAAAIGYFLLVPLLGLALAVDLVRPVFATVPVTRAGVVGAHATLAVFGAVLTTVVGALYQLGPMFTQTERGGVAVALRRLEELTYPPGVLVLATGRLFAIELLGRLGGAMVLGGLACVAVVLASHLLRTQVPRTPMVSRYAVATAAMAAWIGLTLPAWLDRPLAVAVRLGSPGTVHLLLLGAVGFVVFGTLYHVVPFVVWVHRYSDRLGREAVPTAEDLYSHRLAAADVVLLVAGGAGLVAADSVPRLLRITPLAGGLVVLGAAAFAWNLFGVIRRHSPHSLRGVLRARRGTVDPDEHPPS